ncbi:MAG: hypothetical protein R2713_08340 [Ilumatobacteraceae bacterium]
MEPADSSPATSPEIEIAKSSSTTSSRKYGEISHQLTSTKGTSSTITRTNGGTEYRSITSSARAATSVPPTVNNRVRVFSNGASRMSRSATTSTNMITATSAATATSTREIRPIRVRTGPRPAPSSIVSCAPRNIGSDTPSGTRPPPAGIPVIRHVPPLDACVVPSVGP